MPAKPSNLDLMLKLSKILNSPGAQPESITAAGEPAAAPIPIERSGCRAVDECIKAYNEAFRRSIEKKEGEYTARKAGAEAYRQNMPALLGSRNIADFIACVAHGLVLGAIPGNEATRLLYAAQVAHTAIPTPVWAPDPPRRRGRPRASEFAPDSQEPPYNHLEDPEFQAWHAKNFPTIPLEPTPKTQNPPSID